MPVSTGLGGPRWRGFKVTTQYLGTDGPRDQAFLSNLRFCGTKATCPKNFPLLILKTMPGKEGRVGAHDAFPLGLSSLTSAPGAGGGAGSCAHSRVNGKVQIV